MSKKRVIYQSDVAYVGPSPADSDHIVEDVNQVKQLHRVTEIGAEVAITRLDINQMGQLSAVDRLVDEINPTATLKYNITDGYNERVLGLYVNRSGDVTYGDGAYSMITPISGFLSQSTAEKNYFFLTVAEGKDAILSAGSEYTEFERTGEHQVISVGNGFISNYAVEASVGGMASASVSVEGLDFTFDTKSSGAYLPVVNESGCTSEKTYVLPTARESSSALMPSALRAGDIKLDFLGGNTVGGAVFDEMHVQNFSISLPIGRESLKRIGTKLAYSKEIKFPINATISMSAFVSDMGEGNLASLLCSDTDSDLLFKLYDPNCTNTSGSCSLGSPSMVYYVKGASLSSQKYSNSVGGNSKTIDLSWEVQLGGIGDYARGIFISGADLIL
jgi:hypothetical protein